jgi:hypothetical protein
MIFEAFALPSAWVGTNGAAPKGGKQTTKDVEAYFKINDVKKLVSVLDTIRLQFCMVRGIMPITGERSSQYHRRGEAC